MDAWELDYSNPVTARAELGVLFLRILKIYIWQKLDGTRRRYEFSMDRWYVPADDDSLKPEACLMLLNADGHRWHARGNSIL